ncbi:hypothetical protein OGAPHI_002245 [Ogataea philodendri]|uniref:Cytosolic endo-beta-N-acetylglucosaminidase TIM barrel domain-containing protein n=1 Tax=Ogataea philodendri TaxID=1378263 RepID=A0A9P8T748_9ASCO|nr:uncharacterized protein OGAPHI_002245 [Ogataea philodendri]KAH3668491.1 hypothetical protein OGAPHI_002245 [Ogataea philodendri]
MSSFRSVPESSLKTNYLSSLGELAEWSDRIKDCVYELDDFKKPTEPLAAYKRSKQNKTSDDVKLLVCHDFKGGYQENEDDSLLGYFPHPDGKHYYLQYPQLVDKFVYFSHHRISIPPASWINFCHKNGIKCFGTIIFEGNAYTDFEELDKLVTKKDGKFQFVDTLLKLVDYFQFDGFLLNIETRFSNIKIASLLEAFVEQLRAELHVHRASNELIWYDSYIYPENKVVYKNGVNDLNYNFFASTDAFFTNYWWNMKHLQDNIKNIGLLGCSKSVYVGYDVWGRGTLIGKGGYDTAIACQMIKKFRSNVAIFAPAWTYEYLGRSKFIENDTRYWIGLHDNESSIATSFQPHNSPLLKINDSNFMFYTNFNSGEGVAFYESGERVFDNPWVNGSLQLELPFNIHKSNKNGLKWGLDKSDSYHGGSCLKVKYTEITDSNGYQVFNNTTVNTLPLFSFRQDCDSLTTYVKVTYKLNHKMASSFKLKVSYYIERRYRNVQKVRSGCLIIPLMSTTGKWFTIEEPLHVKLQTSHEFVVLDSAVLCYEETDNQLARSYVIEDSSPSSVIDNEEYEKLINSEIYFDDEDEDWILVPSDIALESIENGGKEQGPLQAMVNKISKRKSVVQDSAPPVLKLGELAVINANEYPSSSFFKLPIVKTVAVQSLSNQLLLTWDTIQRCVWYHLIFVDDKFVGVSLHTRFLLDYDFKKKTANKNGSYGLKVRVDSINRLGVATKGVDLYL